MLQALVLTDVAPFRPTNSTSTRVNASASASASGSASAALTSAMPWRAGAEAARVCTLQVLAYLRLSQFMPLHRAGRTTASATVDADAGAALGCECAFAFVDSNRPHATVAASAFATAAADGACSFALFGASTDALYRDALRKHIDALHTAAAAAPATAAATTASGSGADASAAAPTGPSAASFFETRGSKAQSKAKTKPKSPARKGKGNANKPEDPADSAAPPAPAPELTRWARLREALAQALHDFPWEKAVSASTGTIGTGVTAVAYGDRSLATAAGGAALSGPVADAPPAPHSTHFPHARAALFVVAPLLLPPVTGSATAGASKTSAEETAAIGVVNRFRSAVALAANFGLAVYWIDTRPAAAPATAAAAPEQPLDPVTRAALGALSAVRVVRASALLRGVTSSVSLAGVFDSWQSGATALLAARLPVGRASASGSSTSSPSAVTPDAAGSVLTLTWPNGGSEQSCDVTLTPFAANVSGAALPTRMTVCGRYVRTALAPLHLQMEQAQWCRFVDDASATDANAKTDGSADAIVEPPKVEPPPVRSAARLKRTTAAAAAPPPPPPPAKTSARTRPAARRIEATDDDDVDDHADPYAEPAGADTDAPVPSTKPAASAHAKPSAALARASTTSASKDATKAIAPWLAVRDTAHAVVVQYITAADAVSNGRDSDGDEPSRAVLLPFDADRVLWVPIAPAPDAPLPPLLVTWSAAPPTRPAGAVATPAARANSLSGWELDFWAHCSVLKRHLHTTAVVAAASAQPRRKSAQHKALAVATTTDAAFPNRWVLPGGVADALRIAPGEASATSAISALAAELSVAYHRKHPEAVHLKPKPTTAAVGAATAAAAVPPVSTRAQALDRFAQYYTELVAAAADSYPPRVFARATFTPRVPAALRAASLPAGVAHPSADLSVHSEWLCDLSREVWRDIRDLPPDDTTNALLHAGADDAQSDPALSPAVVASPAYALSAFMTTRMHLRADAILKSYDGPSAGSRPQKILELQLQVLLRFEAAALAVEAGARVAGAPWSAAQSDDLRALLLHLALLRPEANERDAFHDTLHTLAARYADTCHDALVRAFAQFEEPLPNNLQRVVDAASAATALATGQPAAVPSSAVRGAARLVAQSPSNRSLSLLGRDLSSDGIGPLMRRPNPAGGGGAALMASAAAMQAALSSAPPRDMYERMQAETARERDRRAARMAVLPPSAAGSGPALLRVIRFKRDPPPPPPPRPLPPANPGLAMHAMQALRAPTVHSAVLPDPAAVAAPPPSTRVTRAAKRKTPPPEPAPAPPPATVLDSPAPAAGPASHVAATPTPPSAKRVRRSPRLNALASPAGAVPPLGAGEVLASPPPPAPSSSSRPSAAKSGLSSPAPVTVVLQTPPTQATPSSSAKRQRRGGAQSIVQSTPSPKAATAAMLSPPLPSVIVPHRRKRGAALPSAALGAVAAVAALARAENGAAEGHSPPVPPSPERVVTRTGSAAGRRLALSGGDA